MKFLDKQQSTHYFVFIFAAFAATLFFFQYRLYVPTSDDLYYQFVCNDANHGIIANEIGEGTHYIESFSDVLNSMDWFYNNINGRYLVHVAVQACVALMDPGVFAIINAVFYALFLLVVYKLCIKGEYEHKVSKFIVCSACLWLLIPFQGNTFLGGVATTINYLWTSVFVLSFFILHHYIFSSDRNYNIWKLYALAAYGAFVGSLQESFSVGLAGSFFFYLFFKRKQLKPSEWYLIIGLFIGTAICVFAPGNMVRLDNTGTAGACSSFLLGCLSSWAVDVFIFTLVVLWLFDKNSFKNAVRENIILLGVIFFNSLFCIFIAYIGRHQLTCISLFSLMITLRIWFSYIDNKAKLQTIVAGFLLLLSLFVHIYVYDLRKSRYDAFTGICSDVLSGKEYVASRDYDNINYAIASKPFICHYFVGYMSFLENAGLRRGLSLCLTKGKEIHLFDNFYPDEPRIIAEACKTDCLVSDNVYHIFNNNYVVVYDDYTPCDSIDVTLAIQRRAFFLPDTEEMRRPIGYFMWNDRYYYLLGNRGNLERIIGVNKIIKKS